MILKQNHHNNLHRARKPRRFIENRKKEKDTFSKDQKGISDYFWDIH